jgi:hypothetical protein
VIDYETSSEDFSNYTGDYKMIYKYLETNVYDQRIKFSSAENKIFVLTHGLLFEAIIPTYRPIMESMIKYDDKWLLGLATCVIIKEGYCNFLADGPGSNVAYNKV